MSETNSTDEAVACST